MKYLKIIEGWSDEQWRNFGLAFLQETGWNRDWKSDVDVFSVDDKRFFVSFRHNIIRGSVGTDIETDILSRLKSANAEGFVGFYSGDYTTSLDERLRKLDIQVVLVSGTQISVLLPYFQSFFIDRFFGNRTDDYRWPNNYYLNKSDPSNYKPLYCMCGCQKDILRNAPTIGSSAAFIHRANDKLYFIYGLKNCIFSVCDENTSCGWTEINQILHPDQFNIWNGMLSEYVSANSGINFTDYYKPKRIFTEGIMQRMRSVNTGFFFDAEEF